MDLYIKQTKRKGRGVFAARNFSKGEVIELCPVIVLSNKDFNALDDTLLYRYCFCWDEDCNRCAIVLGYGSIYNHSYSPNAVFEPDFKNRLMRYVCIKSIKKDDEVTINYNGDPDDKTAYEL